MANRTLCRRDCFLFGIFVVTLQISGCGEGPGESPRVTLPAVGSSYTYSFVRRADPATPVRKGSFTYRTERSGVAYNERKNVAVFTITPANPSIDSMRYSYEANGDVLWPYAFVYTVGNVRFEPWPAWSLIASANTSGSREIFSYDSTATIDGTATRCRIVQTVSYDGSEAMAVGGTSRQTQRVISTRDVDITGTRAFHSQQLDTIWFAPAIGMPTKTASHLEQEADGQKSSISQEWLLTGYSVK